MQQWKNNEPEDKKIATLESNYAEPLKNLLRRRLSWNKERLNKHKPMQEKLLQKREEQTLN
jgi:hypothetical protein